jgi:hypothetical protein
MNSEASSPTSVWNEYTPAHSYVMEFLAAAFPSIPNKNSEQFASSCRAVCVSMEGGIVCDVSVLSDVFPSYVLRFLFFY